LSTRLFRPGNGVNSAHSTRLLDLPSSVVSRGSNLPLRAFPRISRALTSCPLSSLPLSSLSSFSLSSLPFHPRPSRVTHSLSLNIITSNPPSNPCVPRKKPYARLIVSKASHVQAIEGTASTLERSIERSSRRGVAGSCEEKKGGWVSGRK